MKITKHAICFSDENNNVATFEFFGGEEEARKAIQSLVRCKNCVDCKGCTDCNNCTDCTDCNSCTDCFGCHDCKNCIYYINTISRDGTVHARRRRTDCKDRFSRIVRWIKRNKLYITAFVVGLLAGFFHT